MNNIFKKPITWWILSLFGFGLLGICYILAWNGTISYFLFWISTGISCLSLLMVLLLSKDTKVILFTLFVLGLVIYSMHIYRTPEYFLDRDEMMHYQGYTSIIERGNLDIHHTTFPIIQNYPGLELIVAEAAIATNLEPMICGKILIGIVHSMVLVLIWLFFFSLGLSNNLAGIGAFIYALNPRYLRFDSMVSYESIGIFLFFVLILLIQKKSKRNNPSISILFIISLCSLVIVHHVSSWFFLLYGLILMGVQCVLVYFKKPLGKEGEISE